MLKFLGTLLFINKPTSSIIYKLQWKASNVSVMDVLASLCTDSQFCQFGSYIVKNRANNDYFSESSRGPLGTRRGPPLVRRPQFENRWSILLRLSLVRSV